MTRTQCHSVQTNIDAVARRLGAWLGVGQHHRQVDGEN